VPFLREHGNKSVVNVFVQEEAHDSLKERGVKFSFFKDTRRIMKRRFDVSLSERGVGVDDLGCGSAVLKHFENQINHDPCPFETRFSVAYLRVDRDVLLNKVHKGIIARCSPSRSIMNTARFQRNDDYTWHGQKNMAGLGFGDLVQGIFFIKGSHCHEPTSKF
jgi:hypothetical protein